jgi:hypothetical protein
MNRERRYSEETDIVHIRKEANTIEETLETGKVRIFRMRRKSGKRLFETRHSDTKKIGIARVARWRISGSSQKTITGILLTNQ